MTNTSTGSEKSTRILCDQLQTIIDAQPASLKAAVADEALAYDDDPRLLFRDLARCGCAGGTVHNLIMLRDTHRFFEVYYDDIEALREDWEYGTGTPLDINGDLKNALAWFGFEETARLIADALEILE
jgi:hypothetical protein